MDFPYVINLTIHQATEEQVADGVRDLTGDDKADLVHMLEFNELPEASSIEFAAEFIANLAVKHGARYAMIGGANWLMAPLETALLNKDVIPYYSFSKRAIVEELVGNTVVKTSRFRHMGFVPAVASCKGL